MPNHVEITIHLHFEPTWRQQKILSEIVKSDKGICEYYIPMPEVYKSYSSPAQIVSEEEYQESLKDTTEFAPKPITQEMYDDIIKKHKYKDWYQWANSVWGTKWGTYQNELYGNMLQMQSAWSPPHDEVFDLFAKDFPDFTVVYCEEQGWGGEVVYECGEVITDRFWNIPEYECVDEEEDIYYLKTPLKGSDYIEEMPVGYYNGRPIVGWADYIGDTYVPNKDENEHSNA